MGSRGHPQPKLRTMTLAELLTHPFPEREDLVSPWLRQGESMMLWAPTGIGKTMLSLSLALAVAGGGQLLGWTAPKPRSVLYVDGEMHIVDLRDRLKLLAGTVEGCDLTAAGQNLTLLSRQHQDGETEFPDLATPEGQEVIRQRADAIDAELVVLDNFSTLAEVADENEAAAMSPVLTFLLRMKQAGRACILVHHSGKGGTDFRGSSKLATTFEVIIGLRKSDGRTATDGAGFELGWDKFRGKPTAATRDAEVVLQETPMGPRWQSAPAANVEVLALLDAVRTGRHQTQRDLAAALGWDASKVTRLKGRAIGKGLISSAEWRACMESQEDVGGDGTSDF